MTPKQFLKLKERQICVAIPYGSRDGMVFNSSKLSLGKATLVLLSLSIKSCSNQSKEPTRYTELTSCSSEEKTGRSQSIHIRMHVT